LRRQAKWLNVRRQKIETGDLREDHRERKRGKPNRLEFNAENVRKLKLPDGRWSSYLA